MFVLLHVSEVKPVLYSPLDSSDPDMYKWYQQRVGAICKFRVLSVAPLHIHLASSQTSAAESFTTDHPLRTHYICLPTDAGF